MAAVIEIQVKADIQQAAIGLRALLADLTKTGTISTSTASTVQASLNKMTNAVEGFSGNNFSGAFVQSTEQITKASGKIMTAGESLNAILDNIGSNVNLGDLQAAFQSTNKTVLQLEGQIKALKGAIDQTTDPAIIQRFSNQLDKLQSQLGNVRITSAVKIEKIDAPKLDVPLVSPKIDTTQIKLLKSQFEAAFPSISKLNTEVEGLNTTLKSTNTGGIESAFQRLANLDFTKQFADAQNRINDFVDKSVNDALKLNNAFEQVGKDVNVNALVSAFQTTDKSAEQLVSEIVALRGAISQTLDPKIIERFGNQINILQSQLGDVTIKSAIKIEKVDTQNLNVPLVPVDVSQIKLLKAQIDGTGPSIEKLNAQIDQVGVALNTATNPKDVALLKQNFEELKASLATVQTNALQTAFIDAIKPAQQLENEIAALKEGVRTSLNPDDIVKFSGRIEVLSAQLSNIKFGGLDLSTVSSPLNLLQSAFVDSVKSVQQLENELEALDRTLIESTDSTSVKILGSQIIKLKQQLASVKTSGVEGAFNKIGASSVSAAGKLKQLPKASDSASFALLNLGRVAQDAPFGILGIANNLNPLLESFQRVQKEAGGTKNALKAVIGSLAGGGGLGFALSIASSLAIVFGDKLFGASKQAEQSKKKFDEVKQSLQQVAAGFAADGVSKIEVYRNALLNLTTPLDDRNKVLDKYNKLVDKQNELSTTDLSNINKINSAVNAQIKIFEQRALVKAAEQSITDFYKVVFENQFNLQKKIAESGKGTANEIVAQLNAGQRGAIPVASTGVTNLTEAQKAAIPVIGKFDKNIKNSTQGLEAFNNIADISGFTIAEKGNAFDKIGLSANGFINNIKNAKLQIADLFQFINGIQKEGGISVLDNFDAKDSKANDSTKFNFFEKFFDLKPPIGQVQKQLDEMFQAAHDYAQKNVDLFQVKVGDKFIDLSELQQVGKRKEVVELGKKVWTSIREGLVKFKPPKIELPIEIQLVPNDTSLTPEQVQGLVDRFTESIKGLNEKINIEPNINVDEVSKADEAIKAFQQRIDSFSKDASQLGSRLGAPIEKAFKGIISNSLSTELNKGIKTNMSEDEIKKLQDRLKGLGENLAIGLGLLSSVLGNLQGGFETFFETIISGGGNAFQKLGQAIAGMITKLIASLAAMAAISGLLSLIIPGSGSFANVFKGLVSSSLGIKPFASGGLVFGPTMGLVGEGKGTSRSNPEVIAPLDKLKNFLSPSGGLQHVVVTGRLSGNDILISNQRQANKNRRNG